MGYWRESMKWWLGPEHAWQNLGRGVPNDHLYTGAIDYQAARTWPLVFPDIESLQTFWATMERFVGPTHPSLAEEQQTPSISAKVGGRLFKSVDELLAHPVRDFQSVTFAASGRNHRHITVALHIRNSNTDLPLFAASGGFVFVNGSEIHSAEEWIRFTDVTDALVSHTRPATLRERIKKEPVITKFTEAQYYAQTRAAKVRRQAWVGAAVISLIGGYFGAYFQSIFGG